MGQGKIDAVVERVKCGN